ncbi:MAG: HNH endonuclease [Gloeomargaritaceae cyanobacterium C42_A2020_066]|nr:HNH endonuclease [Gloeomargaritaceae cyanobacterium C42_A2020_066]
MGKPKKQVCVYCGSTEELTTDHVAPLSRWRDFCIRRRILDNPSNRVLACRKCNSEKGNMTPAEWFKLHPEYSKRFTQEARYLSDRVKELTGLFP